MPSVFISYARDDRQRVEALAERLRRLVDGVWFDSQLHGGENWWGGILERIRGCDVFVAVVSRASLDSEACRIEREYADSVNRAILPVALDTVPSALPSDLATRQIVDFSQPGEQSLSDLARALLAVPTEQPLPDPLPPEPEAPLSYLIDLVDLVDSPRELTKSEQMEILFRLERGLESPDADEREGAQRVLERMKARDDLALSVGKAIDLLAREDVPEPAAEGADATEPAPSPVPPAAPVPDMGPPPVSERVPDTTAAPVPQAGAEPPPATVDGEGTGHRRRGPLIAAVAVVLVALVAGIAWLIASPEEDGNGIADDPSPTAMPTAPTPTETEPSPTSTSPYEANCPGPVTSFPGEVAANTSVTTYEDKRIITWMCLLRENGVISDHELNFTGNYGGELPPRVVREKRTLGYPEALIDPTLDQEFYDCLVNDICPGAVQLDGAAPDGWPTDVPVPAGTMVSQSTDAGGLQILVSVAAGPEATFAAIETELLANGWEAVPTSGLDGDIAGYYEKDGRSTFVGVSDDGSGGSSVSISHYPAE